MENLSQKIENNSDTHCFGENFHPISLMLEGYTVSNIFPEYSEQVNIQICTGVTSLTLDSG